jgi:LysR substrate binding domain
MLFEIADRHDVTVAELVAALRERRVDAGLSHPPLVDDLASEVIMREPAAAALPEGHPLASRNELTLADLAASRGCSRRGTRGRPGTASTTRTSRAPGIGRASCSAPPLTRTARRPRSAIGHSTGAASSFSGPH